MTVQADAARLATIAAPAGIQPAPPIYRWIACDLVSGAIIDELPLQPVTLTAAIGSAQTTSATLPLPDAPASWAACTTPGRALLVCTYTDSGDIVWGGIVTNRDGGTDATLDLSLVTVEGYLDRRFMGDYAVSQGDEADIVEAMLAYGQADGIGLVLDTPSTGTLRDVTYADSEDATVYARLTDLMGLEGGPEWTVLLSWDATGTHVVKTFRLRPKLGTQAAMPSAVFDLPGCVSSYTLSEDFTSDNGANDVVATGDADPADISSDPARAQSSHQVADDLLGSGWPKYEARINYSGVTDTPTLDAHAVEDLTLMRLGARSLDLAADAGSAPRFGSAWRLGDTVKVEVDSSPRHSKGFAKVLRATGVSIDTSPGGLVTPTLVWQD